MRHVAGLSSILVLAISSFAADNITTIAGGGSSNSDGPALSATLFFPEGIATDAAGNIYIADSQHYRICKLAPNGTLTTIAGTYGLSGYSGDGPALGAQLSSPVSLALDAAGNLYFADQYSPRVRKIDTAGNLTTLAGGGDVDATGTGESALSVRFSNIVAVALNAAGDVYFSDGDLNRIFRISAADGTLKLIAGIGAANFSGDGGPATSASLNNPADLAIDAQGNIYVADANSSRVRRIDAASGVIETVVGNDGFDFGGDGGPATAASLDFPSAIALDSSGNLYISDSNHGRIRRVDAATKVITTVAGNGVRSFYGDGGPALSASLLVPLGLAFDASGNLLIADTFNNRIRKVAPGATSTYDSDGDGFPDHVEAVAGSSATDASATPFSGAAISKIVEMNLKKMLVQLNFGKASSDKIQAQGSIDIPDGTVVSGKQVLLDIGGVAAAFSLDAKGKSTPKGVNALSFSTKPKNGALAFTAKLDKGNFAAALADENLISFDTKGTFVTVPIALYFNNALYLEIGSFSYKAKAGKTGKAGSGGGGGVGLPGTTPAGGGKLGR
jgi:sugar lactone lactonase YvrE